MSARRVIRARLGTAGVGRRRFRAWLADEFVDRGDGDDADTCATPGAALRQLAARCTSLAWLYATGVARPDLVGVRHCSHLDLREVSVVDHPSASPSRRYVAMVSWPDVEGSGATPADALESLAGELDVHLALLGWIGERD